MGESALIDDKELLQLEKEEAALWWGYVGAIGFTFFVTGIIEFQNHPTFIMTGLIFLVFGNLIYNVYYYPRQRLLIRKRLIEIELRKTKKK